MSTGDALNSEERNTKQVARLRRLLSQLLISGSVLTVVLIIAAGLTLILRASGDAAGAAAVRGLAWVAVSGLALNLLALISALTFAVLQLLEQKPDSTTCTPADRPSSP
ncbi:hypothetical protein GC176_10995 [bacterium]|nr:hypothetical protein [bacterium]